MTKRIRSIFAVILCICILGNLAGCSASSAASKQYAISCAKSLQAKCKAPSSFEIEEDVLVFTLQNEKYRGSQICYIKYSAQNSFGVQISNNAIFCDGTYLGSEDDVKDYEQDERVARESMASNEEALQSLHYCQFLLDILIELHTILLGRSLSGDLPDYAETISTKQVMKALK